MTFLTKSMQYIQRGIKTSWHFLTYGMWHMHLKHKPFLIAFAVKVLRVLVLSVREFHRDKCQLRASALTFYSVLSIVPVLAMAFGIAKGFNLDKRLKDNILQRFNLEEKVVTNIVTDIRFNTNNVDTTAFGTTQITWVSLTNITPQVIALHDDNATLEEMSSTHEANAEIIGRALDFADNALQNTRGGLITGISVLVLFWMVIKVLSQIELSMNAVWGVTKSRHIGRKFTDYLSLMLICPLLIIMSGSLTVFIQSQVENAADNIALFGVVAPAVMRLLRFAPYVMVWFLFSFIYLFMPNTKVKWSAGIVAGIISGTLYQLVQWVYITFQVGAAQYSAIYGSFAALPLFLVWLQVSWVVVLFGAEFSFAFQNVDTYEFEDECANASFAFRQRLALLITHSIITRFAHGEAPPVSEDMSEHLDIPLRLLRSILDHLIQAGIIRETLPHEFENPGYVPARDIKDITIAYVLRAMQHTGTDSIPITTTPPLSRIRESLSKIEERVAAAPENTPLTEL